MSIGESKLYRTNSNCSTIISQKMLWENQHTSRAGEHNQLENIPNVFARKCASLLKENSTVLEVGTGNGRDARFFVREKKCTVIAVDFAESAILQLRQAAIRDGTLSHLIPVVSSAQELSLTNYNQVDALYARSALHLCNDELYTFLEKVDSILSPHGYIMIEGKTTNPFQNSLWHSRELALK